MEFEDGSVMRLYRQTIEDFGLYAGMDLAEEQLASLQEAAGLMSAKMRAIRIVTASDVSKIDLRQRLIRKGETPEQADAAVEWMDDLDLIDDRRTAELIVSRCAARGYGLARAKQALYEKRIPKQYWEEVLADYPDQSEDILMILRSKIEDPNDQKQIKKAIDAALRRGHSYRQVRRCLEQLSVDTDEFPED